MMDNFPKGEKELVQMEHRDNHHAQQQQHRDTKLIHNSGTNSLLKLICINVRPKPSDLKVVPLSRRAITPVTFDRLKRFHS
jgi:hypothetical protein